MGRFALALWMARDSFAKTGCWGQAVGSGWETSRVVSSFLVVNRDIFLSYCYASSGVNLFFTSAGARQGDMDIGRNTRAHDVFFSTCSAM
jgi:hypothetical protein